MNLLANLFNRLFADGIVQHPLNAALYGDLSMKPDKAHRLQRITQLHTILDTVARSIEEMDDEHSEVRS